MELASTHINYQEKTLGAIPRRRENRGSEFIPDILLESQARGGIQNGEVHERRLGMVREDEVGDNCGSDGFSGDGWVRGRVGHVSLSINSDKMQNSKE